MSGSSNAFAVTRFLGEAMRGASEGGSNYLKGSHKSNVPEPQLAQREASPLAPEGGGGEAKRRNRKGECELTEL